MGESTGNLIGQQFGNYRLLQVLGEGGFARVYLGEQIHLKTKAAIKILHTHLTEEQIEDFRLEARNIAHLDHPHIVRVLDFGVENNGIPYLVMNYAPDTLRRLYPRGVVVPLPRIVEYVSQVADALDYAHQQKLIHRDVKPENMLMGSNNEVLLSDFGIAQVIHSSRNNESLDMAGTIYYMAPEQINGKPRYASDQYALAIVTYEWLCGAPPFLGSLIEVATQHVMTPPPPLQEKMPTYRPEVEEVVRIALSKDSERRFATVHAFATALEQASASTPRRLVPLTTIPIQTEIFPPRRTSGAIPTPTTRPQSTLLAKKVVSRRAMLFSIMGIGIVSVGGGLLLTKLFSASTPPGTTLYTYLGHHAEVYDLTWSPNSKRIASGGTDNTVQVCDALNGANTLIYTGHNSAVSSVAWSPNGKYIASCDTTGEVHVWDAITSDNINISHHSLSGAGVVVQCVAWSPDSKRIVSGDNDTLLQVWSPFNGGGVFTYRGHTPGTNHFIVDVAWSPDGQRIASAADDKTVQVWDAATGKHTFITYHHRHSSQMWAVAWSPNGQYIASGGADGTVEVWHAASGVYVTSYSGHRDSVDGVAWSPSGQFIASASYDGTVQVWHATNGTPVLTYAHHTDHVDDVLWSPDGRYLASCGRDKTVQIWQAPSG